MSSAAPSQIHDLGHTAYSGPRTSAARRVWAIARNVFALAWRSRWGGKVPIIAAVATTVAASLAMFILRSSLVESFSSGAHGHRRVIFGGLDIPKAEAIVFFAHAFYSWGSAFLMAIIIAAAAVADDLRMGSFLFYFARPLRVRDYLAGKLLGLALLIGVPMFAGPMVLAIVRLIFADDWAQAISLSPVLWHAALLGVMGTAAFVLPAVGLGALVAKRQTAQAIYVVYLVLIGPAAGAMGHWLRAPILGTLSMTSDVEVVGRWLFGLRPMTGDAPVAAAAVTLGVLCVVGLALAIVRVQRAETAGLASG